MTRYSALKALAVEFDNASVPSPRVIAERARAAARRAEFRADAKHARRFRALGWAMIALGVLRFVVQDTVTLAALCGVLFVLLARWLGDHPIASIANDRVELKSGWLSFRRSIHAEDIRDVLIEANAAFIVLDDGRRVRLPLSLLDTNERGRLLNALQDLRARFQ